MIGEYDLRLSIHCMLVCVLLAVVPILCLCLFWNGLGRATDEGRALAVQETRKRHRDAFQFGQEARRKGVPANANPLTGEPAVQWLRGWMGIEYAPHRRGDLRQAARRVGSNPKGTVNRQ